MGDDLFILGFPLRLNPTGPFPIWKRASVATEMNLMLSGMPAFLVDTATREGMSGAPVVTIGQSRSPDSERQTMLVGVYSGRHIGPTAIEAQLGVVWRRTVISEIIALRQAGAVDLTKLS